MKLPALVDRMIPGAGSRLDRVSQAVQASVSGLATSPRGLPVAKALHGNEWLGHPLHPVIVVVPIGAWSVTGWYDWRSVRSADAAHEQVADAALRVGVLGAVAAAITGFAQFLDTRDQARRETTVHAALNNVALSVYLASMGARAIGQRPLGRKLSAIGFGLVSVSGYLGGDLSYRHGVGVKHAELTPPAPPDSMVPAAGR